MPLDDSMIDAIQDWRRYPEATPQELRPNWPPERQQDMARRIAIIRRDDSDQVVEESAPAPSDRVPDSVEETAHEPLGQVPGRVGRYQTLELLGEGAFGQVWKAVDPESGRLFAIKLPSLAPEKRERALRMLRDESRWLVMLREVVGVLPFQDWVLDNRYGFALVMDYMPGGSLAAVLKSKGTLPTEEAARLMIRIARTVAAASEREFIHQDLKPANILIDESGQPWVADFGLAVFEPVRRHHESAPSGGTRLYRAPEQLRGEADHRSDIWALGIILWEMLTGSVPFRDETEVASKPLPPHLLRKIPPELGHIVRTCLQKDPDQRFLNAGELAHSLEIFISPPGVTQTLAPASGVAITAVESRYRTFESRDRRYEKIFGRKWAVDRIKRLAADRARCGGLIVVVGQPGKGKSALMAHLAHDVFMACEPSAIVYAYHSPLGMTSPDDFVRTVYGRLLQIHHIADESDPASWHYPEVMLTKLNNFVHNELANRATPANPQLVMVDALDEARKSHTGRAASQMVPESLPPGVVFIVSSRPGASEPLLCRLDAVRFDLDDPDDRAFHDQDARAYIDDQFQTRRLTSATADEIVRASKGNFLVLKHLCVEIHMSTDETRVFDLLQRLLRSENGLLAVYEDFWERLARGLREGDPELYRSVCEVAGVLAMASDRMSADMVCSILGGMKLGKWISVRRRLGEYIEPWIPDGGAAPYYRMYHDTFAEFIRTKVLVEGERKRLHGLIADFCLRKLTANG